MTVKITNMRVRGCPVCQNTQVGNIVDPLIFSCTITLRDLLANLENRGIVLDYDVLKDHSTHVFTIDEDSEDYSVTLKTNADLSNLEIVKDALKKILIIERNFILSGKEDTKEFISLLKEKRDLLTLKAKMEGELNEGTTIVVGDWITKVPPRESLPYQDAELLPEKTE